MNDDGVIVNDFYIVQVLRVGMNVRTCRSVGTFERELDISSGHFIAVVELYALTEIHLVILIGEELPFFSEAGSECSVMVEEYESVIDVRTCA